MMVDLQETGAVDAKAIGFGSREPFFTSELEAHRRKRKASTGASVNASPKQRVARAA